MTIMAIMALIGIYGNTCIYIYTRTIYIYNISPTILLIGDAVGGDFYG